MENPRTRGLYIRGRVRIVKCCDRTSSSCDWSFGVRGVVFGKWEGVFRGAPAWVSTVKWFECKADDPKPEGTFSAMVSLKTRPVPLSGWELFVASMAGKRNQHSRQKSMRRAHHQARKSQGKGPSQLPNSKFPTGEPQIARVEKQNQVEREGDGSKIISEDQTRIARRGMTSPLLTISSPCSILWLPFDNPSITTLETFGLRRAQGMLRIFSFILSCSLR